jgi:RsiW-degrading membrane proteinase PrsW (M82 family)
MQIIIQRNGQEYGPYPLDTVRKFLADGSLYPHDLARDVAEPLVQPVPLERLLAKAGVVLERASAREQWAGWRALDLKTILPLREIFSPPYWQDRRFIYLSLLGLMPVLLLGRLEGPAAGYWIIAAYVSVLWSLLFYSLFSTPQTEVRACLACFGVSAAGSVVLTRGIMQLPPWSAIYPFIESGSLLRQVIGWLGVGINEELSKAAILFYLVRRPGSILAPQTVVLYGLLCGLGFGIHEAVIYQTGSNRSAPLDVFYFLNFIRLTSLPFLHAIWTGIAGYFIAFAALNRRRQIPLWVLAIAIPAVLHALYDVSAMTIPGIVVAVVSVGLLSVYLASAGRMQKALS